MFVYVCACLHMFAQRFIRKHYHCDEELFEDALMELATLRMVGIVVCLSFCVIMCGLQLLQPVTAAHSLFPSFVDVILIFSSHVIDSVPGQSLLTTAGQSFHFL